MLKYVQFGGVIGDDEGEKDSGSPLMNRERVCGVASEALESESGAETMEDLKGFMAASLILALAVIIGLHLAFFWLSSDGQIVIGESNKVLLTIECVVAAGIFVFGIERLIVIIRTQLSGRKD
jgi:hypothetical protein